MLVPKTSLTVTPYPWPPRRRSEQQAAPRQKRSQLRFWVPHQIRGAFPFARLFRIRPEDLTWTWPKVFSKSTWAQRLMRSILPPSSRLRKYGGGAPGESSGCPHM